MFQVAVRETEALQESFALVIHDDTFVIAVRSGVLSGEDVELLDRIVRCASGLRGVSGDLAVTA